MEPEMQLTAVTSEHFGNDSKIKTHFAKIIVGGDPEKPCFSILYYDPTDREYHIGFGSFCLDYVFKWRSENFEIVDGDTWDAVEVVRCKDCAKEGTEQCPMVHRDSMFGNLYAETKPMGFCSYGERKSDEN